MRQPRPPFSYHHVAVEIPEGKPQLRYFREADQWAPRGHVLRCLVSEAGGEAVIEIDGRDFSAGEFGRMLTTFAGWACGFASYPKTNSRESQTMKRKTCKDEGGEQLGSSGPLPVLFGASVFVFRLA